MINLTIENEILIPVRVIPYVTGWKLAPDDVARILANKDGFHRISIPSFHISEDNNYYPMLSKEWDVFINDLESLTNLLKSNESIEDENYERWRKDSIIKLPPATFVWQEDLKQAWAIAYSEDRMSLPGERHGERQLNFDAYIPPDMLPNVYTGFESLNALIPASSNETCNTENKIELKDNIDETIDIQNKFILKGDFYEISFQGESTTLKNTLGLRYILYLIQNQNKEIPVFDLHYAINSPAPDTTNSIYTDMSADQFNDLHLTVGNSDNAGLVSDHQAIQQYKKRVKDIQTKIEDAEERHDVDQVEILKDELDTILRKINESEGLSGRSRKLLSNLEKTRQSICKRISTDRKKITSHTPNLGQHLDSALTTGTQCCYKPHPPVKWHLKEK